MQVDLGSLRSRFMLFRCQRFCNRVCMRSDGLATDERSEKVLLSDWLHFLIWEFKQIKSARAGSASWSILCYNYELGCFMAAVTAKNTRVSNGIPVV